MLIDALTQARATDLHVGSRLHRVVAMHARDAHTNAVPPERLIAHVKQLARDRLPPGLPPWVRDKITEHVVAWTIGWYYDRSNELPGGP
jgi:hypothetical protein